jgi:hypothetical protein
MSLALLSSSRLCSLHTGCVLLSLCALSALGCSDLEGFNSKPGEAYCGTIGLRDFQEGFVEEGSPSALELALTLDTSKLPMVVTVPKYHSEPGILNSNDPQGICGTPDAPQVLFEKAAVRVIPKLQHDVLSALTFGEGHDYDFFGWVDSTCQGTMLAVISLMKNNYIELRLFKPARLAPLSAPAAQQAGFALFHLDPKPLDKPALEGGCGFPPP